MNERKDARTEIIDERSKDTDGNTEKANREIRTLINMERRTKKENEDSK
jgi:hypothetical protein